MQNTHKKEILNDKRSQMIPQSSMEAPDYQVGDLVLVNAKNIILPRNFTPKFNQRYYGPYRIRHRFNQVTYQLDLPPEIHIHNSFHVSLLKRFRPDTRFGCQVTLVEDPIEQRQAELILKDNSTQFLVKWHGRPLKEATWVSKNSMPLTAQALIEAYETTHPSTSQARIP
ncbi:hypothetical protein KP509_01G052600 [Ceratopteris richardii]|uniref:Chromo domain-containing protein n=1 Tax=Ceratopteris richardii TaxID=49495 RepID=A0A8T2VJR8_CERRI|nr:hypothetical protein KP509_01G052600 [Ceratopteris richardii]